MIFLTPGTTCRVDESPAVSDIIDVVTTEVAKTSLINDADGEDSTRVALQNVRRHR